MKKLLLFASVIVLISCAQYSSNSSGESDQSSTGEFQEGKNPLSFLFMSGNNKKNLFGKFVIDGSIQIKATIATYKDITLSLIIVK